MKNRIVKGVLLGWLTTMVISCNAKKDESATPVVDKEQIKKEIQAKEDEFAAFYNSSQLKNIGYYADDAMSFFPNRAPLVGKDSIVNFLKTDLILILIKFLLKPMKFLFPMTGIRLWK